MEETSPDSRLLTSRDKFSGRDDRMSRAPKIGASLWIASGVCAIIPLGAY